MSAINTDNRDAWQAIANEVSAERPDPGKRVIVMSGRKHKGRVGTVERHQRSRFVDAFRYASDAQAHMREMAGRYGFVVLVRDDAGASFWVDADKVDVQG